jgi:DNA polymerase
MRKKPDSCAGCPLYTRGQGFARTDGKGNLNVAVVAEALGQEEARASRPLVGPAGRVWDRIVQRTFYDRLKRSLVRDDFLLANIVNCRPPDNELVKTPYETAAIDSCRMYLEETLNEFKPKAVVTLGNSAMRWFTGHWGIEKLRGYVFDTPWGPVVPTYHPSFIQRGNFHLARVVETDLLKALEVARNGIASLHRDKHYNTHPSPEEFAAFYQNWRAAGLPDMSFDIETPHGSLDKDEDMSFEEDDSYKILLCSFAYEPFTAISVPFIPPYIDTIKAILRQRSRYLVWNAKFDVPRLMANGVDFGGQVIDVMIAWHWLEPQLPMGLKYVATFLCPDMSAWKLKQDEDFAWYNCADSDVLLRAFMEIQKRLEKQGRWKVFERHFLEYGEILAKMTERGIHVDRESRARSRAIFEARKTRTVEETQALAPAEVCKVHPRSGYKKTKEQLEKAGLFVDGEMRKIKVEVTDEEAAKAVPKTRAEKGAASTQLSLLSADDGGVPSDTSGGAE